MIARKRAAFTKLGAGPKPGSQNQHTKKTLLVLSYANFCAIL